jgi:predicted DNA-binding transcriptional regulator YafY
MEALSGAGIPVYAERGLGGGWALVEGYRTNLTGLTRDEIQALFLTKPLRLLTDLGLDKASDSALIKLEAGLPSMSRDAAEYARQRIHVDITGWRHSEESFKFLPALQEAVWQDRKVQLTYQRGIDCDSVERLVEPLGLVAKRNVWYLVAAVDGDVRSYRVSRVIDAKLTDQSCQRPAGFDLATHWEQSTVKFKEHLPQYRATLRVAPEILFRFPYAGRFARVERVEEDEHGGWATVDMRFQMEEEAIEYVLSFGSRIEVVEPLSLRDKVIDMAKSVIKFYNQLNQNTPQ